MMKPFFFKITIFFSPIIFLVLLYLIFDPFKVIWNYSSFYNSNEIGYVDLNKGFVSTRTFEMNYPNVKYNSFIFGNSRSICYPISEWEKYITSKSECFHFDAEGESLYALHKKIAFLDDRSVEMKHALLILDFDVLVQDKPRFGTVNVIPPQLEKYNNFIEFHSTFLKAFFNFKFIYAYFDFKFSKEFKPYMKKDFILNDLILIYDNVSNEVKLDYNEKLINDDKYYTDEIIKSFTNFDSVFYNKRVSIRAAQKKILRNIHEVFSKHNTKYKIIINPLFDKRKLSSDDLDYLKLVFGDDSVFDYSGINNFTTDYKNYYDVGHYRPQVAREILREIYND